MMMGAGNVKRVYARWGDLQGPAFRLLTFIAVTIPDRESQPRCELSRESLAAGLGYPRLDAKADRAVTRALSSLTAIGALERAQRAAPGRRAHYWLVLSMEHLPPDVQRSNDNHGSNVGQSVSEHLPPSVQRSPADTVLPYSGEDHQEKNVGAASPAPPLRTIPGGATMPRSKPMPGQRALNLVGLKPVTSRSPDTVGNPLVQELVDRCRARGVQLPKNFAPWYGKLIKQAQEEGFHDDLIRQALASMVADNVVHRPSLLPARLVSVQTGPERRTRPSTTDATVADAIARGERLQAELDRKALSS